MVGKRILMALAAWAFGVAGASALPMPLNMPLNGPTAPPAGHVQFCADNPDDCRASGKPNRVVRLTPSTHKKLLAINVGVNHAVVPATDMDAFGVLERWSYPALVGDCEDYVIQKRHDLIAAGFPDSALLITVVRDERGDGHAVLTVRTDLGDLILDNKTDTIRLWSDTPYRYIKRQSGRMPSAWDKISDRRTPMVGSVRRN